MRPPQTPAGAAISAPAESASPNPPNHVRARRRSVTSGVPERNRSTGDGLVARFVRSHARRSLGRPDGRGACCPGATLARSRRSPPDHRSPSQAGTANPISPGRPSPRDSADAPSTRGDGLGRRMTASPSAPGNRDRRSGTEAATQGYWAKKLSKSAVIWDLLRAAVQLASRVVTESSLRSPPGGVHGAGEHPSDTGR